MKRLKQLIPHLFRAPGSRQGKKGSSLAMVMMIGAALVIWVMCIMPLMSTTGSAVYKTQGDYDSYLLSRSAIEFCKSELEKIVEEKLPYTFAVTGDLDEGFTAVAKWTNGLTVRPEYSSLVNSPDPLDDRKDVPTSDDVQAICAVETNATDPGIYDIVITTYKACEKQMTYKATFVPTGSLMIHPESYKQNQALPLSDFVVVDGKMGPNTVWNSNITMSKVENSQTFTETLLPWIAPTSSEWHAGYANTGEYPAVFKTTANSASDTNVNISDPVTEGFLSSDETWIVPQAGESKTAGNIRWQMVNGYLNIIMYTTEWVDITGDCTVYLNGRVTRDLTIPQHGIYTVSIDYKGTDYTTEENLNKYDGSKINVLPVNGLVLTGNLDNVTATQQHTLNEAIEIEKIEKVEHTNDQGQVISTTYTVTLTKPESEDLLYCVTNSQAQNVTWTSNNVFEGLTNDPGTTYYFYACRPASYVDGVFMADSPVKSVGMIFVPKFANSLTDGGKYAIFGHENGTDYALNSSASVDAVYYNNGFLTSCPDVWTTTGNKDSGWSVKNSSGKALAITGKASVTYSEGSTERHQHGLFDYERCPKTVCTFNGFEDISVSLADNGIFYVSWSGTDFQLFTQLSEQVKYKKYTCGESYWGNNSDITERLTDETSYLSLNGSVSASYDETTTIRFMELPPAAPSTPAAPSKNYSISNSVVFGTNVLTHVGNAISGAEMVKLYANNQEVTGILNAGTYHMVVKVKNGNLETWANLGNLTVTKANLDSAELTVSAVRNVDDELRIDVSVEGWHNNGGVRYFGYKEPSESKYHWYTSNDQTFAFRLKYGTYQFAVRESGNTNYNGTEATCAESVTLDVQYVSSDKININDFIYTFDESTGDVVWYELPDEIIPLRVKLVFGYYWESRVLGYVVDSSLVWSDTYKGSTATFRHNWVNRTHNHAYYGVIIEGTDYNSTDNVFRISTPVDINTINGHTSSMMRGSSLYFMDTSGSINTHGTDVYLTTDLLVLNSDIIGGGSVVVEPYNSMEYRPGDTLLFVSNPSGIVRGGQVIFQGRNFYRIPANTDLCNLNASTAASWRVGDITNHTEKRDIDYLFRNKVFPEINLDIAYADQQQLSRIINSETIGWSRNGVISGSSTSSNPSYAITAYLTGMNGDVSYKANRVLIAANVGGAKTLNVTDDLSITTRYLSVEADQIIGTGGSTFMLYNLAQDQDFLMSLINSISGLSNYSSKSLQMDYERPTMIISNSGTISMQPQICRYDHGTNLLGNATSMSLMAEYSTSEIERLFRTGIFADSWLGGLAGSTVKTVDRYISLKADNEDGALTVSSVFTGNELDIYANYVYVDSSVKEINLKSGLGSNDIRVSSQESGYTTFEYLGIFKGHSAETYTGTILYFSGSVKINLGGTPKTVAPGFYWIQATDNGTSLTKLAENPAAYAIDPEELRDYSVYINPDGTLSNSYVDTGLLDNTNAGIGGFSGGNME